MAGCKRPGSCDELPPAVQGSRIPVKDHICMASGLIAVEYSDIQFFSMLTEHAATAVMFGICKGGCRNVDNPSGTATGQFMCRIYRIAVIRVLVMMLPKIFTNGNPYLKSIQFSGFKNFIGFKVS